MNASPIIRLSKPSDRDAILAFVERMNFNPRDAVTWDGLRMIAMTAWLGDELIGAIPMEPRRLRVAADRVLNTLHETVVSVAPEHRSAGIGSRMQEAIAQLRPGGSELLTVFREQPHSPAYRWYVRNGFSKVMAVESWLHENPLQIAQSDAVQMWDQDDPLAPWIEIEAAWSQTRAIGSVDRASRRLQEWLAVHPYRNRYKFHVVSDGDANWALIGVGTMHSPTPRLEVMEIMMSSDDPMACEPLLRAIATVANSQGLSPLRIPLAATDPRIPLLSQLGFRSDWPFDMLARPLVANLPQNPFREWRYASIDYI